MSFVEGFYSFKIDLNDTIRGVYEEIRLKLVRHPNESVEYLYARLIAYLHAYEDELTFTEGLYQPKQPTIWRKDIVGEVITWVEVGCPSRDKMMRALRHHATKLYRVYFTSPDQIDTFCHYLRGSKTNWVEQVTFHLIDPIFLERLAPLVRSSSVWSVTLVDNVLYLVFDQVEFETTIQRIDIWERFQTSIENVIERN